MRITVVLTIAAVGAASLVALLSFASRGTRVLWIPFFPCAQRVVYEGSTMSFFTGPECPSSEEVAALTRAMSCGGPPPPGFKITSGQQDIVARTTGAVDWLGRHEVEVDLRARSSELVSARLYLNDRLVSEADDVNGCVFRYGDDAEAVLSFFAPWLPHYRVELVSRANDGRKSRSSFAVGQWSRSTK